jgi:hypothetical protein
MLVIVSNLGLASFCQTAPLCALELHSLDKPNQATHVYTYYLKQ